MRAAGGYDTPQGSLTTLNSFPAEFSGSPPVTATSDIDRSERGVNGSKVPRILLMGMRRSGKTSIFKVVFHKMSPHETLFLESTVKTAQHEHSSVVSFKVWDFAGSIGPDDFKNDAQATFAPASAVLFVIDAQDDLGPAVARLVATIECAYQVNRRIFFEVFIHKVDTLPEESKLDLQREVSQQVLRELTDRGCDDANLSFYLSSIYDHSVFENVSKVVQKLVPSLATLEALLDLLISQCRMDKAFLFDVMTKVYIATDSQPVDVQSFELSFDVLDVIVDVSCIYGQQGEGELIALDDASASIVTLSDGKVLYVREVARDLALVCLMRAENLQRQGLVDYNVQILKQALKDVMLSNRTRTPRRSSLGMDRASHGSL